MASTLHQATRYKELLDMFHFAGHVMSYREVIKLDNALTKNTLQTMDNDGAVVPANLVKGCFVHFTTSTSTRTHLMEKEHSTPLRWLHDSLVHLKVIFSVQLTLPRKRHCTILKQLLHLAEEGWNVNPIVVAEWMSLGKEGTHHWHGIHHILTISYTNAFMDIVQPQKLAR